MIKFLGMPYPIQQHARGYFHVQFGLEQIKSDLLTLVLTNRGERVMLPTFGVSLRDFIFELNDDILVQEIRQRLIDQINLWEPRVVIENISITPMPGEDEYGDDLDPTQTTEDRHYILLIRIEFLDPENIREVQELVLEIPVGGA